MLSRILNKLGVIIFFLIFLFSCENEFPEYNEREKGIYHKLISFDEDTQEYKPNRYVKASILFYDNEKLIFKHYKEDVLKPAEHNFGSVSYTHLTLPTIYSV